MYRAAFFVWGVSPLFLKKKFGPNGIDAATHIVGFFVSAMGMGLVFHGVVEFLQSSGIVSGNILGL